MFNNPISHIKLSNKTLEKFINEVNAILKEDLEVEGPVSIDFPLDRIGDESPVLKVSINFIDDSSSLRSIAVCYETEEGLPNTTLVAFSLAAAMKDRSKAVRDRLEYIRKTSN